MNITKFGNPNEIKRICEWTGKEFVVDWKHRNQRFINKDVMYAWRKSQNRETINCPTCGNPFERYKRILHPRSGKLTQYCSNKCSVSSDDKRKILQKWIKKNNPMNNLISRNKIRQSKIQRYGDGNYNNIDKMIDTNNKKYGVPYAVYLPQCKSNGKRISKFQKQEYEKILLQYPDAKIEEYLPNVQKFVDIYIPSVKKVIECHGDYWHCNPIKCSSDYYNKVVHLTAQEIWDRDDKKRKLLEQSGYQVEVVWENTNKHFKHEPFLTSV